MRPVIRLSLFGILAGMSLWLVGCSKTEAPAPVAPAPPPVVVASGKKPAGGGVMDLNDAPAPAGIKPGLENGKLYSAKPKGQQQ